MQDIYTKVNNITSKNLSIYDEINIGDLNFWLTGEELELYLNNKLIGLSLAYPLRTRSKVIKTRICEVLGYPTPKSFKKKQPRFTGQLFDVYVQKSNNLQVWNEELSPERRYVLIRIDDNDIVIKVKVITGASLAPLDTTGTLTQKFQARLKNDLKQNILVNNEDTDNLKELCRLRNADHIFKESPIDEPSEELLFPISILFQKLKLIIGATFKDPGKDQERLRGAELHKLVCKALNYPSYKDNGQFPDLKHQLLEIKTQTSQTIDLGLVTPDSTAILDINQINNIQIRHCDVRYAIFYGSIIGDDVLIENFVLASGETFFTTFIKCEGKGLSTKIQIPLPKDFFNS